MIVALLAKDSRRPNILNSSRFPSGFGSFATQVSIVADVAEREHGDDSPSPSCQPSTEFVTRSRAYICVVVRRL